MKIYLASSWRNTSQPAVLASLREAGHIVYDFRNPIPGEHGFSWKQVGLLSDRPIQTQDMKDALVHPTAVYGFGLDFHAMKSADACVLLLPCGRSAHLEAGWMAGAGKFVLVMAPQFDEPELMYKCFEHFGCQTICPTVERIVEELEVIQSMV